MTDFDSDSDATRRAYLTTAAAVLGGSALSGCASDGGSTDTPGDAGGTDEPTATPTDTPTDPGTATETPVGTQSGVETPYSVSIEPVGEVTFESVPETWIANNGSWADMGIALGLDAPEGVWLTGRYHTQYYDEIPGVSVDKSDIKQLWGDSGVGKEQFYEIDADVHVADPNFLVNRGKWEQSDVDEITEEVAPFFGNSIFSRNYAWHSDYRYYTLMEGFEKLAQVFKRTDRYEAFEAVHDDFQAALAPVVPTRSERPSAAVIWGGGEQPESFYPYVFDEGTSFKHLNDLKVRDALADSDVKDFYSSRGAIDFETLLEVDPEVILLRGQEAKSRSEFEDTVLTFFENHDTASALTAVRNGDVYRAGALYQGPISNLVVTERLATALYDTDDELFDRQRVGDIVAGNV
ncbi:ABC transporter substrate-binding protein [Halosimplex pelagicum]|uniref:ABC transporter substrate-binding protein n=1 Tax=Halosimplex pelagicum TaxID=869886 RepID=A0A7D5TAG2_9EURY|nr:ABC transporter substrate-binding protein [Halosimplex pelagicum]QLH81413.1 ABC transporter substrate-binding protein [Halosimplex pelagicum]